MSTFVNVTSLLVFVCVWMGATESSLTDLYNSEVVYAEYHTRPLSSGSSSFWRRKRFVGNHRSVHAGVVVRTDDGRDWLIHKGDDYGNDRWRTVITDARHMSSRWTREKCGVPMGTKTVHDFMQAGLISSCGYNLRNCNCQHAANGMWDIVYDSYCRNW